MIGRKNISSFFLAASIALGSGCLGIPRNGVHIIIEGWSESKGFLLEKELIELQRYINFSLFTKQGPENYSLRIDKKTMY